jgi:hypothetical protein
MLTPGVRRPRDFYIGFGCRKESRLIVCRPLAGARTCLGRIVALIAEVKNKKETRSAPSKKYLEMFRSQIVRDVNF